MEDVKNFRLEKLEASNYIKPMRIRYVQNNREKIWDLILCHASVYIVLYNTTRKKLVFVKQFRPAVYFCMLKAEAMKKSQAMVKEGDVLDTGLVAPKEGITLELCAGIVDKEKNLSEIARDEAREECGYEVPADKMEEVQHSFSNVGIGGESCHMFYAEVTDAMKTGPGGGLAAEGELIEVVEMSIEETREYVGRKKVTTSPASIYGIMWFLLNKV